jgi:hypothetical protein
MNRRSFLGAAVGTLLTTRSAWSLDLVDMLGRVARARSGLRSLAGPFTQVRRIGLLAAEVRSTGSLTFLAPDRLRWELAPPDAITYWMTPEGLAYRGRTGQGRLPSSGGKLALEDLRVVLGGDLTKLRTRYELRGETLADGGVWFEATARISGPRFEFALAPDLVRPTLARIWEQRPASSRGRGKADRTDIRFGLLERDGVVDRASLQIPF